MEGIFDVGSTTVRYIVITVGEFELPYNESSKSLAVSTEKMERYLRKAEAQVYVIGTREPYFPSSAAYSMSDQLQCVTS